MSSEPKGVYLESSVLCGLPLYATTANLQRLILQCELLGIPILIPETSFLEWIAKRKEKVREHLRFAGKSLKALSGLFGHVSDVTLKNKQEGMINDTEALTKKIIDDCGISIIETPEIDVKKAVQMAVDRVKPFEEKHEKGFRDYVNLCTVLEYARVKRDGFHLLIAGDAVYRGEDVRKLAVQYGVELIVRCSIEHAISALEGCVGSKEKEIRDKELQPLKSYLMTMTDEVSIYIFENVVIDEFFLSKNNELGLFPQIEAVDDIRVTEVTDEVRGVLPEDTREGRVKITFLAKTKVLVRMQDIAFPSETVFIQGRKVSSGQAAYLASLLGGGTGKTVSREIERLFSIAGSVSFKRGGSEKGNCIISYSDLDLDHVSVPL